MTIYAVVFGLVLLGLPKKGTEKKKGNWYFYNNQSIAFGELFEFRHPCIKDSLQRSQFFQVKASSKIFCDDILNFNWQEIDYEVTEFLILIFR